MSESESGLLQLQAPVQCTLFVLRRFHKFQTDPALDAAHDVAGGGVVEARETRPYAHNESRE